MKMHSPGFTWLCDCAAEIAVIEIKITVTASNKRLISFCLNKGKIMVRHYFTGSRKAQKGQHKNVGRALAGDLIIQKLCSPISGENELYLKYGR
jgi:hypothetical protein